MKKRKKEKKDKFVIKPSNSFNSCFPSISASNDLLKGKRYKSEKKYIQIFYAYYTQCSRLECVEHIYKIQLHHQCEMAQLLHPPSNRVRVTLCQSMSSCPINKIKNECLKLIYEKKRKEKREQCV